MSETELNSDDSAGGLPGFLRKTMQEARDWHRSEPYGGDPKPEDLTAIWECLSGALCPGYVICRFWIPGGSCCGAAARQAVQDWKNENVR